MSELQHSIPLVSTPVWTTNVIMLYSVRAAQFTFTVITLGLTGYLVNEIETYSITQFALAISVISLVFLIAIAALTFLIPGLFIPGALLISEFLFMILWFSVFISLAADWGRVTCSSLRRTETLGSYFISWDYRQPCRVAQAAIAMAAISWVLFAYSSFLLVSNIARPLSETYTTSSWWECLSCRSFEVHKVTGLALVQANRYPTDIEAIGLKGETSTGNSNLEPINTEKAVTEESHTESGLILGDAAAPGEQTRVPRSQ